jgi:hypothetical protein
MFISPFQKESPSVLIKQVINLTSVIKRYSLGVSNSSSLTFSKGKTTNM